MSYGPIDPASLQGDALTRWYLRSPDDIEQERQAAATQRYQQFFGGYPGGDPEPGFDQQPGTPAQDVDPGFSRGFDTATTDIDPRFSWVPVGANRWRSVSTAFDQAPPAPAMDGSDLQDGSILYDPKVDVEGGDPRIAAGNTDAAWGQKLAVSQPMQPPKPPLPDPARTDVFQTGADGKLHPIPGWHTTGPFDFGAWSHNIRWGGVAKDLGDIAGGALGFLTGGAGWTGDLISELGPEVESAITDGIAESPAAKAALEAIHGHHPLPKFMGGPAKQVLVQLPKSVHDTLHQGLAKALREAGFPRVGGRGGRTLDWAEHFRTNPGSRKDAFDILRRVTRDFDQAHGTDISPRLPDAPNAANPGASPPS